MRASRVARHRQRHRAELPPLRLRTLPPGRQQRPRAPTAASASAWRSCGTSSSCTAATSRAASDGEGKGATFTVTLPLSRVRRVARRCRTPASRRAGCRWRGVSRAAWSTTTTPTRASARRGTHAVRRARARRSASADEALDASSAQPPRRPRQRHRHARRGRLRPDPTRSRSGAARGGDIPAIALTAYARAEDRERILASGFGSHLVKPVDPMTFVRTVREAAGR